MYSVIGSEKTSYEIDQEYGVHSAQVGQWKKAIQEQAKTLLEDKRGPKPVDESNLLIARLIDEEYTRHRSMAAGEWLYSSGRRAISSIASGVQRLTRQMGLSGMAAGGTRSTISS